MILDLGLTLIKLGALITLLTVSVIILFLIVFVAVGLV